MALCVDVVPVAIWENVAVLVGSIDDIVQFYSNSIFAVTEQVNSFTVVRWITTSAPEIVPACCKFSGVRMHVVVADSMSTELTQETGFVAPIVEGSHCLAIVNVHERYGQRMVSCLGFTIR